MKPQLMVAAEGGACGNFIGTQVYLMVDPAVVNLDDELITKNGSCDEFLPHAVLHLDMFRFKPTLSSPYPFTEAVAKIGLDALSDPDQWYAHHIPEIYKKHMYITVTHWVTDSFINDAVKINDLKIVYVSYTVNDTKHIATNKILKNLEGGGNRTFFKDMLVRHSKLESLSLLEQTENLYNLPRSVLNDLIDCWKNHLDMGLSENTSPTPNKNLLIINFSDIYNDRNRVLNQLSDFLNVPITQKNYDFYDTYINAQNTVFDFINGKNV